MKKHNQLAWSNIFDFGFIFVNNGYPTYDQYPRIHRSLVFIKKDRIPKLNMTYQFIEHGIEMRRLDEKT